MRARRKVGRMRELMSTACLSLAGSASSVRLRASVPDTRTADNTDNNIITIMIPAINCNAGEELSVVTHHDREPLMIKSRSATTSCKLPLWSEP